MGNDDRIKIVSLHGYNSSHETGYEAVVRDAFSGKYDFECVNLLGHGPGRDIPKFYSLSDVISDAVGKISKKVDGKTFLIGTSFGAYPVMEYLRQNSDVDAAVFVKPMVDMAYTFSSDPSVESIREILKIDEALKKYPYGTKELPFDAGVPFLIFSGKGDVVVGDARFARERIVGRDLRHVLLDGGHSDNRASDVRRVIVKTRAFFASL